MSLNLTANPKITTGDTIIIKTSKHQTIGKDAPAWLVTETDVIEVGNTVTSVKWTLNPVGEHTYTGASTGQHEYAVPPTGRHYVVN